MSYIALALIASWTVTVIALLGVVRSRDRQHARERDLLLNQLLHAVGKPWIAAPASNTDDDREPRRVTVPPDQIPVFD